MGGSTIGVWCAHGEGQCIFPDDGVKRTVLGGNLAPIRWVGPGLGSFCTLTCGPHSQLSARARGAPIHLPCRTVFATLMP